MLSTGYLIVNNEKQPFVIEYERLFFFYCFLFVIFKLLK